MKKTTILITVFVCLIPLLQGQIMQTIKLQKGNQFDHNHWFTIPEPMAISFPGSKDQDYHKKDAYGTMDYGYPPEWSWAQQFSVSGTDQGRNVIVDNKGNDYITRSFSSTGDEMPKKIPGNREDLWVMDSMHYYYIESEEMIFMYRSLIMGRDGFGNPTQTVMKWHDTINNKWINATQYLNSYDDNGLLLEYIYQVWDTTLKEWVYQDRYLYDYDSYGNETEQIMQRWSSTEENWETWRKTNYEYDAANRLTKHLSQSIDYLTGNLRNSSQKFYYYGTNDSLAETISQIWSIATNEWYNDSRVLYEYSNDNFLIRNIYQEYVASSYWRDDRQHKYTYNDEGLIEEVLSQNWDLEFSVWENDSRYLYLYDLDGDLTAFQYQYYEDDEEVWMYLFQYLYTYDENKNRKYTDSQFWNHELNDWETANHIEYFWSFFINITEISKEEISIYPNPTNGIINITLDVDINRDVYISILDATGRLIRTIKTDSQVYTMDITGESAGIYFIKIGNAVEKIILK